MDRLERKEKSALDLGKNEIDQSPKQDSEFLRSKAWKKGFLSSNKVEKVEKVQDSQPRRPSSNESRTTRGILKYTSTSQSQPETVSFPSESPIRPRDSLPLSNPLQPPMLSETHVTIPEERPPPEEKKRVSKFMAERMGGVNMIADMNSTRSPSSSTKPFTGKIIERG